MAQEGIYKNPILLNQATHKDVKIAGVENFNFARELNSVLVTGYEFLEAAKHYPIVFVSGQDNDIVPVVILGLSNNENLFLDEAGRWKGEAYIPSFIRRYPFILAENDQSGENFSVSIDAEFEGFDKDEGIALFDGDGNPSKALNKTVEFLRQYQMQNMITQEFVRKLSEYNLLKDFTADITMPAGQKIGFKGLKMVNEKAFLELDDEKALELFRRGFIGWIYGHLHSLSNFRALGVMAASKISATAAA